MSGWKGRGAAVAAPLHHILGEGVPGGAKAPPPHVPKVSTMVHNFGHVLSITIGMDYNVSKCIILNYQNFPANMPLDPR